MVPAARAADPAIHAWLDEFVQAPARAFGDLLAGYARVFPYDRADAPDAARMLFGPLPVDHPARLALGPAVLEWLRQRRQETPPADRPRLQRWIREICDALESVSYLKVDDAALELRRRFVTWNEWASRFVLAPARDARAEYWRMLALTQPLLADQGLPDLSPFWLQICRRADADLPHGYLSIGLAGLRCRAAGQRGADIDWVAGLAYWALDNNPPEKTFMAQWLALKPLYPRTPAQWVRAVEQVLSAKPFRDAGIEAPAWWKTDPDFAPKPKQGTPARYATLRSPGPSDTNAVIERLGEPWPVVTGVIDRLLQDHRRFVTATGDAQFFVLTLHRLGAALLRPGSADPLARARKAQRLAQEGLAWNPADRYLWSLWRDSLAASGALEAAECVGWEAIRRDPEDVDARTQLATLLAGPLGRPHDADALLRDTIAAFPQNPVARTQRAELLIGQGQYDAAEEAVAAAFAADAANGATYALQARLRSHRGDLDGAAQTVQAGLRIEPSNLVLQDYARILASGRPLRVEAAASLVARPAAVASPAPDDAELDSVARLGRIRRLRARAEAADDADREAALQEVQQALRDDPGFAYAALLARRYGLQAPDFDSMPPFAVAFEHALTEQDHDRLDRLAERQPRLRALTLLAKALLGDADAAWTVATLLQEAPPKHEATAVALLRRRLAPLLGNTDRAHVPDIVAANRDSIRRTLHDANETLIGEAIAA
jgi:tetratricopeptide (TPR) repeat protein